MRKVLFTLHVYVALFAGIFVAILGVTGGIMAFEPEIDHLLHARLSYVTPHGRSLSLAQISDAIARAFPGEHIGGFLLSTSPNISAQVSLRKGLVYINQYTGEILGIRTGGMDFLGYVHQLHLRLLIRNRADSGKTIVSWAGVAMLYLLLSGSYLWWPLKRFTILSCEQFWFDFHNTTGILAFAFLLILTITGLMIGFDEITVPAFYRVTGSAPPKPPMIPPPAPGARAITPDQAMQIAKTCDPRCIPISNRRTRTKRSLSDPLPVSRGSYTRRTQSRDRRSVHRRRPVRRKFADGACGCTYCNRQPGGPYGRHLRNPEQGDHVSRQPDGGSSIDQRSSHGVEEAAARSNGALIKEARAGSVTRVVASEYPANFRTSAESPAGSGVLLASDPTPPVDNAAHQADFGKLR